MHYNYPAKYIVIQNRQFFFHSNSKHFFIHTHTAASLFYFSFTLLYFYFSLTFHDETSISMQVAQFNASHNIRLAASTVAKPTVLGRIALLRSILQEREKIPSGYCTRRDHTNLAQVQVIKEILNQPISLTTRYPKYVCTLYTQYSPQQQRPDCSGLHGRSRATETSAAQQNERGQTSGSGYRGTTRWSRRRAHWP